MNNDLDKNIPDHSGIHRMTERKKKRQTTEVSTRRLCEVLKLAAFNHKTLPNKPVALADMPEFSESTSARCWLWRYLTGVTEDSTAIEPDAGAEPATSTKSYVDVFDVIERAKRE